MWNNLSHQSTRNEHTKRERCSPLLRLTSSLRQQNNALIEQLTIVSTVPIRHFYENKLFNGTLNYEVCSSLNRNFDTFKTSDTVQNYRNTFSCFYSTDLSFERSFGSYVILKLAGNAFYEKGILLSFSESLKFYIISLVIFFFFLFFFLYFTFVFLFIVYLV